MIQRALIGAAARIPRKRRIVPPRRTGNEPHRDTMQSVDRSRWPDMAGGGPGSVHAELYHRSGANEFPHVLCGATTLVASN